MFRTIKTGVLCLHIPIISVCDLSCEVYLDNRKTHDSTINTDCYLDSLLTQEVAHSLKMTDAEQEKIADFRKNIAESLRILDEIVEIIRFQDNPGDTIIDQKLEEIRKILSH